MRRGGVRPGAGRPHKFAGEIDRAELLAAVAEIASSAKVEALFVDARSGSIASLRQLTILFEAARQNVLRNRDGRLGARPDSDAIDAAQIPSAADLFAGSRDSAESAKEAP